MDARPTEPTLALERLSQGLPALTVACGRFLAEAAAVCLGYHGHLESIRLHVEVRFEADPFEIAFSLTRPTVTDQMQLCYNDLTEATEYGACAIAILVIQELTGLTLVRRSRKGTGFDYWLGKREHDTYLFEETARLEVSGILSGDRNVIEARIQQKLRQTLRSAASGRPAYVAVVEFGQPAAYVIRWEFTRP